VVIFHSCTATWTCTHINSINVLKGITFYRMAHSITLDQGLSYFYSVNISGGVYCNVLNIGNTCSLFPWLTPR